MGDVITFLDFNLEGIQDPHDDTIVISVTISNYDIGLILVDNRSSIDVLFYDAFHKINLPST